MIGILIITIILQKTVAQLLSKSFKKSSKYLKVDETNYRFFKHFISAIIYVIGISTAIYAIPSLRTLSVSIFAGAGILAVIIGFASQHAFSNVVSGIFITIFKPFRVGDRITIGNDVRGIVEDINLRHTTIKTFENKRLLIPNAIISNDKIENSSLTEERICRFVEFNVSYETNLDHAINIMKTEAVKHPHCLDNRNKEQKENNEPIVQVRLIGFTDSAMTLRAWVWAKDSPTAFIMGCDLNKLIKEKFDQERIVIPYPHRTIVYKKNQNQIT